MVITPFAHKLMQDSLKTIKHTNPKNLKKIMDSLECRNRVSEKSYDRYEVLTVFKKTEPQSEEVLKALKEIKKLKKKENKKKEKLEALLKALKVQREKNKDAIQRLKGLKEIIKPLKGLKKEKKALEEAMKVEQNNPKEKLEALKVKIEKKSEALKALKGLKEDMKVEQNKTKKKLEALKVKIEKKGEALKALKGLKKEKRASKEVMKALEEKKNQKRLDFLADRNINVKVLRNGKFRVKRPATSDQSASSLKLGKRSNQSYAEFVTEGLKFAKRAADKNDNLSAGLMLENNFFGFNREISSEGLEKFYKAAQIFSRKKALLDELKVAGVQVKLRHNDQIRITRQDDGGRQVFSKVLHHQKDQSIKQFIEDALAQAKCAANEPLPEKKPGLMSRFFSKTSSDKASNSSSITSESTSGQVPEEQSDEMRQFFHSSGPLDHPDANTDRQSHEKSSMNRSVPPTSSKEDSISSESLYTSPNRSSITSESTSGQVPEEQSDEMRQFFHSSGPLDHPDANTDRQSHEKSSMNRSVPPTSSKEVSNGSSISSKNIFASTGSQAKGQSGMNISLDKASDCSSISSNSSFINNQLQEQFGTQDNRFEPWLSDNTAEYFSTYYPTSDL